MKIDLVQVDLGMVPEQFLRYLPKIMARALQAAGEHWFAKYRPLHFTEAAYARYGYKRRSAKYERNKYHKMKHNRPLTWTGRSEALTAAGRVESNRYRVRVVMKAPQLNFRGGWKVGRAAGDMAAKWVGPKMDMRDELTRVNTGERFALGRVVGEHVRAQVGVALSFVKREQIG